MNETAMTLLSILPAAYGEFLRTQLLYAGWHSSESVARLSAWKFFPSMLALPLFILIPPTILCLLLVVLFFLPDLFVINRARKRQSEISAALPQAIDIMLLGVDAGLSLDATLQRLAADHSAMSSALNFELATLGRDILLGMDREQAYMDLHARTGVEELKSFGAALNQSGKLGLSIGKILRAQSEFTRMKRSQKAEEKAARLPIWMAFPLWFCIMPSLLLILLGPSLLLFFQHLSSR